MKIGIICATIREIAPLVEKMEILNTHRFLLRDYYCGHLHGLEAVVVMGGVGKVNAAITTHELIARFAVDKIIFTGVAGALDPQLNPGDIIIGQSMLNHDIPQKLLNNENQFPGMPEEFSSAPQLVELCRGLAPNVHFGRIITGDAFISSNTQREKLITQFQPLGVDMESAAAAQVCWFFQIPLLVIRAISDAADDNAQNNYESNVAASSLTALGVVEQVLAQLSSQNSI